MLRQTLLVCCGLVLLILIPGCDSTDDDGSFRGSIAFGDQTVAISGDAYFAEEPSGTGSSFVLFLTPNDLDEFEDPEFENLVAVVVRREGARPDPGLTIITSPEDDGIATAYYVSAPSQRPTATLIAETGSLTIDDFEDGQLEGSFTFTGTLLDPALENGSATATVSGNFEAERVLNTDIPNLAAN